MPARNYFSPALLFRPHQPFEVRSRFPERESYFVVATALVAIQELTRMAT